MTELHSLAAALPGGRVVDDRGQGALIFPFDGAWLRMGAFRNWPALELAIHGRGLSVGRIEIRHRLNHVPPERPTLRDFMECYTVRGAEPGFLEAWLDQPVLDAICATVWSFPVYDVAIGQSQLIGCDFTIAAGGVSVVGPRNVDAAQIEQAVRAGAALAARPYRLASSWRQVADALGGHTSSDCWEPGELTVTVQRGAATFLIDNVLSLDGESPSHPLLRTRVRARRLAAVDHRWALWTGDVDRRHRPDLGHGAHRLHDLPGALADRYRGAATRAAHAAAPIARIAAPLEASGAAALAVTDAWVTLWWPGLQLDPARLESAIEAVARLSVEAAAGNGPYR